MDVGKGEDRPRKKKVSLAHGYKSTVLVVLGCSGVQCYKEDNVVYPGYVSSVSALWGDFFSRKMMWLLPLLRERISGVLRGLGPK